MAAVARTQVRIPVDLMDWLKQRAREENRSMNAQLMELLKQARKQSE